ncbi:MAG TPA: hypothetical protein VGX94_01470 [Terriglobia bacterium]|nr:hypothetical protein [Terriglobia bacterium]
MGYALPSIGPLCFRTNNELTVTFIARAAASSLAIQGEANAALPLRLNGLFIKVGASKPHTVREWPTASSRSRLLPTPRGNFVVITPDELMLYSADFRLLKTLGLPVGREAIKGSLMPSASPTGNYLLIDYDPKAGGFDVSNAESRRLLVDTERLQVLSTWALRGNSSTHSENISDDGMALTTDTTGSPEIGKPGGPWGVICHQPDPHCGYGIFVGNDAFFNPSVLRSQEQSAIRLMLTNGQLIFEHNLPEKQYVRMTARAADGRRFAVAVDKGKGGSAFFDTAPHYSLDRIMVYDLPSRQWVYALDAKKQGIKSISGLALSPDGSLMALIDQEGILEVYRLPPEGVGTQPRHAQTF